MSNKDIMEKLKEFDEQWKNTAPAEDCNFEPIPEGDYSCIVIDAEMTKSSTDNIGLNVQFEVVEGEYEGRSVYHTFWITDNNIKFVKRDLEILGYKAETIQDLLKAKAALMNKKAHFRVGIEEYEGKKHNRVKWFIRPETVIEAKVEATDEDFQF